jgi:hypothetical protein
LENATMNGRELRERIDAALSGLEGNTEPARRFLFDLAELAKGAEARRTAAEKERDAARGEAAKQRDRAERLKVEAESLRQRLTQATADRAALEGEVTRLSVGPPPPSLSGAVRGLAEYCEKFSDPAEAKAKLREMDDRLRRAVLRPLAAKEPHVREMINALSPDMLHLLLHCGFSEIDFVRIMDGDPNPSIHVLAP